MKGNQLEGKGGVLDQFVLVLTSEEVKTINEALADYVKNNPKKRKVKIVLEQLENLPLFT